MTKFYTGSLKKDRGVSKIKMEFKNEFERKVWLESFLNDQTSLKCFMTVKERAERADELILALRKRSTLLSLAGK